MLLLASALIVGSVGAAALDASYESSRETYNASNPGGEGLDNLDTGRDVGSSIASLIPLLGLVAVPLGLIGIIAGTAYKNRSSGRLRR